MHSVMMTIDQQLEDAMRGLLDQRSDGASISIAEAARKVGGPRWRSLVAPARRAAHRLSQAGEIEIAPRGDIIDLTKPGTPIRIRRAR